MLIQSIEESQAILQASGLDRMSGIAIPFRNPASGVFYNWHDHPYHQMLYASDRLAQIETQSGRYVIPQACSAWIPAGVPHRTLFTSFTGVNIYISPNAVRDTTGSARVFSGGPLLREMTLFALRWENGQGSSDPLAEQFFSTFAALCQRWIENKLPLFLPSSSHSGLSRAMDSALADPGAATLLNAVKAAGASERTFRRTFSRETGMTWHAWIVQARILKAMALLANGQRVTTVAAEVGFSSMSAFAKAFANLTGETPSHYRMRNRKDPCTV